MKWAQELVRIRRLLRDPEGKVWTEPLLRDLYNQAQLDFQRRTGILEDVRALPVPPRYGSSYTYEWEREYVRRPAFRAFWDNAGHSTVTHEWEIQQVGGVDADVSARNRAYTHPWEALLEQDFSIPPRWPFPSNFQAAKGIWHDEKPMAWLRRKDVELDDPTWRSRVGTPYAAVHPDLTRREFSLYPTPSTIVWQDGDSETGMLTAVEDDTIGSESGTITRRTGSLVSGESGMAVDAIPSEDNIVLIYDVAPRDIQGPSDDIGVPGWLAKYPRFKALSQAYLANTDGANSELHQLWEARYDAGIQVVKRFQVLRRRDRDYQLSADRPAPRRRRHARLPDEYPDPFP